MKEYEIFLKTGEAVAIEAESVKLIFNDYGYVSMYHFIKTDSMNRIELGGVFNSMDITGWVELPENKETGHWIMHQDHRECSKCGIYFLKDMPRNSYCPNCGARMTESEDEA